jgi:hypothetical protein
MGKSLDVGKKKGQTKNWPKVGTGLLSRRLVVIQGLSRSPSRMVATCRSAAGGKPSGTAGGNWGLKHIAWLRTGASLPPATFLLPPDGPYSDMITREKLILEIRLI